MARKDFFDSSKQAEVVLSTHVWIRDTLTISAEVGMTSSGSLCATASVWDVILLANHSNRVRLGGKLTWERGDTRPQSNCHCILLFDQVRSLLE